MKKLVLILLICCLAVSMGTAASGLSQWNKTPLAVSVHVNDMKLEAFLELLSRESGVKLLAVPEIADTKIDYTSVVPQTLEVILSELTQRYGLTFELVGDNRILIQKALRYESALSINAHPLPAAYAEARLMAPMAKMEYGRYPVNDFNTEEYKRIYDNSFQDTTMNAVSTFSIDVDTAAYSNLRRFINSGQRVPADAVRTEEMINYFSYDYPQPTGAEPFSVKTEIGNCPWQKNHKLAVIGLQGKNMATEDLPPSNLVFLIDVSGSMNAPNKLPLIKTAFKLLVKQLRPEDKVSVVVYAGRAGVVLAPTSGSDKTKIINAIDNLQAGGSTAGGEGISLAYKIAKENFVETGNNRVILATDGDFNVGISSEGELERLIAEKRNDGIFLSVLGFGMGNIKDNKMETLADKGNGNYAYIDNALEAKKVLVGQMAGTLYTIAQDVKLQVEFNPAKVKAYRLIGYEQRVLANSDFNNDAKDAGDMGAGHTITALYEIVPADIPKDAKDNNPFVYQHSELIPSEDWFQVKIRYKQPGANYSKLFTRCVEATDFSNTPSENFRFAAAVAEYAMILRNSEFKGEANFQQVLDLAQSAKGNDVEGYRSEFIRMVKVSQVLGE